MDAIGVYTNDVQYIAQLDGYARWMAYNHPETRKALGLKLKARMRAAHMTQRKLSDLTGVSQTQISNIVRGKNACSIEMADALAKAFGMKGWQLLAPIEIADADHAQTLTNLVFAYTTNESLRRYLDTIVEREGPRRD
jgi:transcriptional regulator with XRE-family HTH domain